MKADYINLTKEQEEAYIKLVKAIGEKGMLLIHLKHHKDFIVSLDKIKKEAQKELLEKIKKQNTFEGNAYLITKKDMDNLIN